MSELRQVSMLKYDSIYLRLIKRCSSIQCSFNSIAGINFSPPEKTFPSFRTFPCCVIHSFIDLSSTVRFVCSREMRIILSSIYHRAEIWRKIYLNSGVCVCVCVELERLEEARRRIENEVNKLQSIILRFAALSFFLRSAKPGKRFRTATTHLESHRN